MKENKHRSLEPPEWARRALIRFLRDDLAEEVLGDLEEKFQVTASKHSAFRAKLNYWYQVLHYLRPFAIKKLTVIHFNDHRMLKSYFRIGWRNLLKNKGYSTLNIAGLAVGMAVAMLIGLWVRDEFSYEKNFANYERIAQVGQHQTFNGTRSTGMAIPLPLWNELRTTYGSDFKYTVISTWTDPHILTSGDKKITFTGDFMSADAPHMLTLHMLEGSRNGLQEPGSILLSASAARTLFGDQDPLNEMIRIDNEHDVKVTGVYEDLPQTTNFSKLLFIAPWELYAATQRWVKRAEHQWENNSLLLYVQIADNADMQQVNARIRNAKYDRVDESSKQFQAEIFLQPMKRWHLYSGWENSVNTGGLIQHVKLFGAIGVFVLLLACINFMNLSTARSEKRAREVGIRKSMGSIRRQLVSQFLSESFLVVMLSFALSLVLVYASLPWFNLLTEKRIVFPLTDGTFWCLSLAFISVTGFLAGSYPALYLSSFQPVKVLKGTFKTGKLASLPRQVLVTLQFTVSVMLIIGTAIVYKQIQFTKDRPVGYDRNGIMMVQLMSPEFKGKYDVLRNELKRVGAIEELAESSSPLTGVWSNTGNDLSWEGKDPALNAGFATLWITHDYGKMIGWQMKEGRDFSRTFPSDTSAILVNEAAVKYMDIRNPVGKTIRWGDHVRGRNYTIVGVVKDMVMESPFKPVRQAIYLLTYKNVEWMHLRLNPSASIHESVARVEEVFRKYLPGVPLEYKFADEEYARKFAAEERIGRLSAIFAALAIFISCLGLFGLASFVAEQRTKEIGIRKVLGASVQHVWQMLSSDFIRLVVISCVIASPLAYYALQEWLASYPYRTDIPWWIFALTVAGTVTITLLTVSFQAVKAGLMDPVKSLRSE